MARTKTLKKINVRSHFSHVGNLVVKEYAQVGGDLSVDGDLTLHGPLFCLGRIIVKGSLDAYEVTAGQGIETTGDIRASALVGIYDPVRAPDGIYEVASRIRYFSPGFTADVESDEDALEFIVDQATLDELESTAIEKTSAIMVTGDCWVEGPVKTNGDVSVEGHFSPDFCRVEGNIDVRTANVDEGDLSCHSIHAQEWLYVAGDLDAIEVSCQQLEVGGSTVVEENIDVTGGDTLEGDGRYRSISATRKDKQKKDVLASLHCHGDLKAGSITVGGSVLVDGDLHCSRGYLRADRNITSAGRITTSESFGILSGLGVARTQWLQEGYVTAAVEPLHLLTGAFRPLGRRPRYSSPKPARLK
jgi:predicted acyltransferase (DUF342 family)